MKGQSVCFPSSPRIIRVLSFRGDGVRVDTTLHDTYSAPRGSPFGQRRLARLDHNHRVALAHPAVGGTSTTEMSSSSNPA